MISHLFGILLIVAGFTLRFMARRQLKESFTLQLKQPHHIVMTGLYKYIRHPAYLGSLMVIAGVSLICVHLAIVTVAFVFFLSRMIEEEFLIACKHPSVYLDYMKRTGRLLPKLRFKKKGV